MILISIIFILIAIIEYPKLFENKSKKELVVFSVLLFLALIISILQKKGVEIPNPYSGIKKLVKLFI